MLECAEFGCVWMHHSSAQRPGRPQATAQELFWSYFCMNSIGLLPLSMGFDNPTS